MAVSFVLSDGQRHALTDTRLYLPRRWIEDTARCDKVEVPAAARKLASKSEYALYMVRAAHARQMRFEWVSVDAGHGKEPAFLRALDDARDVFVADVHRNQTVWLERPALAVRPPPASGGRKATKRVASMPSVTVEILAAGLSGTNWQRCVLRDNTRGELWVDIWHRRVWVWGGEGDAPRGWHLIVRREVGSPTTIKYTFYNALSNTPVQRLAQMQGQRYWVERAFEDAKGECGLGDYQALSWRSWHHHVTMVMVPMMFIAEQRVVHQPGLELLKPRDIVEILPRKPGTRDALVARINNSHERRRRAIEARHRTQRKAAPT